MSTTRDFQSSGGGHSLGRAGAVGSRAGGTRSQKEKGIHSEEAGDIQWKTGEPTAFHSEKAGSIHWKRGEEMSIRGG